MGHSRIPSPPCRSSAFPSSNTAVAGIDANRHARGLSPGTTTITAASGGLIGNTYGVFKFSYIHLIVDDIGTRFRDR
jgi:hypothetical protein